MEKSYVVSGYICAGKTYIVEKYDDVTEVASTYYNYLLTDEQKKMPLEALKSTKREIDPNWPHNYIDAVVEATKNHRVVLVAPGIIISDLLRERGVDCILAFPDPSCKEEYKRRAKQRGNNDAFLQRIEDNFNNDVAERMAQPNRKIVLKCDEYLEDGLVREGIIERK